MRHARANRFLAGLAKELDKLMKGLEENKKHLATQAGEGQFPGWGEGWFWEVELDPGVYESKFACCMIPYVLYYMYFEYVFAFVYDGFVFITYLNHSLY